MNLWGYIQGIRKGKEANRIEKEAMRDPFLADALAGYEQVKGDHSQQIKNIQKSLPHQTLQNIYSFQVLSVAACLVMLISIVAFFYVYRQNAIKPYLVTEFFESDLSAESTSESELIQTPKPIISQKEYQEYLKKELVRPTDECKDLKGKVVLRFNINQEGRPYNFIILNSLCASADKEAIRLIKEGPAWTTGNKKVEMEIEF